MNELPFVGAAIKSENLAGILDWIVEDNRDLEIQDACLPGFLDSDWGFVSDRINKQLEGYTGRIGIHGQYDGIQFGTGDPLAREHTQKRISQSLDFASSINASTCVIHSPFQFFGGGHTCHTPQLDLAFTLDRVSQTLEPLISLAEQRDCILVVENIFDRSPLPLRALIERFDSPYLKRSIDTGHAAITERCGSGPSPEYWILEANDLLFHIHLQDTNGEYDYHWTLGNGTLNWKGIFQSIGAIDAQPRLIIETRDPISGWNYLKHEGLAQ